MRATDKDVRAENKALRIVAERMCGEMRNLVRDLTHSRLSADATRSAVIRRLQEVLADNDFAAVEGK
jgi:hypothetical protein